MPVSKHLASIFKQPRPHVVALANRDTMQLPTRATCWSKIISIPNKLARHQEIAESGGRGGKGEKAICTE